MNQDYLPTRKEKDEFMARGKILDGKPCPCCKRPTVWILKRTLLCLTCGYALIIMNGKKKDNSTKKSLPLIEKNCPLCPSTDNGFLKQ